MSNQTPAASYLDLPDDLPVPIDDGAADHLIGSQVPDISLLSTSGTEINLASLTETTVIFCYPKTGVPGVALPEGWDDIPGARGCTPQACSYRDEYPKLLKLGVRVLGLSTQLSSYQKELADRIELPYEILSDSELKLCAALTLPTFEVDGETLLKRLTMIIKDGVIIKVHYPVFPSNKDIDWVLAELSN